MIRRQRLSLAVCKNGQRILDDIKTVLDPKLPRDEATELLIFRASHLARDGKKNKEALEAAQQLRDLDSKAPNNLYEAARCYSLRVRAMGKGRIKEQMTESEKEIRAQFAQKAIEALNLALENGYQDMAHVLNDADLDIIRQEDGYRRLIENLGKNANDV